MIGQNQSFRKTLDPLISKFQQYRFLYHTFPLSISGIAQTFLQVCVLNCTCVYHRLYIKMDATSPLLPSVQK